MEPSVLAPDLVERVLARLGFGASPEPDLAGLCALYDAWCRRVPFDNVRKRIHLARGEAGALPGDAPGEFFADWLRDGTGGTCWAGNGALCALLAALGFRAQRGLATMLVAPDLPPNHGTVSVALDGARWLLDASILFQEPLRLRDDGPTAVAHPAWGVATRVADGRRTVRWRPFHLDGLDCRIDSLEATPEEFRRRHEATRSWSPFNYQLSARLLRDDGVVGVAFGSRAAISAAGEVSVAPFAPGERLAFLVETLGLREEVAAALPDDVPMPPPPRAPSKD